MSSRLDDRSRPSVSSNHPFGRSSYPGPHVLTLDGVVTNLPPDLPLETLWALLTIAGEERINPKGSYPRQ